MVIVTSFKSSPISLTVELIDSGIPQDEAMKMAKEYIQTLHTMTQAVNINGNK